MTTLTMIHHILSAYYGEIYGIAFFNQYLKRHSHTQQTELWQTLIDVEILTAEKLKPVLIMHDIDVESRNKEMQEKGRLDAEKWIELPWDDLISTLLSWVEPYEIKYREWNKNAQEFADLDPNSNSENTAFQIIAEHETAIYQCLKQYHSGKSGLPILEAFLTKYR